MSTESAKTFADGMAVRVPHPQAVEVINKGVARILSVTELEIADAIRRYYTSIHNVAEGAGAAALAALGLGMWCEIHQIPSILGRRPIYRALQARITRRLCFIRKTPIS